MGPSRSVMLRRRAPFPWQGKKAKRLARSVREVNFTSGRSYALSLRLVATRTPFPVGVHSIWAFLGSRAHLAFARGHTQHAASFAQSAPGSMTPSLPQPGAALSR